MTKETYFFYWTDSRKPTQVPFTFVRGPRHCWGTTTTTRSLFETSPTASHIDGSNSWRELKSVTNSSRLVWTSTKRLNRLVNIHSKKKPVKALLISEFFILINNNKKLENWPSPIIKLIFLNIAIRLHISFGLSKVIIKESCNLSLSTTQTRIKNPIYINWNSYEENLTCLSSFSMWSR